MLSVFRERMVKRAAFFYKQAERQIESFVAFLKITSKLLLVFLPIFLVASLDYFDPSSAIDYEGTKTVFKYFNGKACFCIDLTI